MPPLPTPPPPPNFGDATSCRYIRVPLETGRHAPCPNEGGFKGIITETVTAAVCCANHCGATVNEPTDVVTRVGTGVPCSELQTAVLRSCNQDCGACKIETVRVVLGGCAAEDGSVATITCPLWVEHPGAWQITLHDGQPCTFYEARLQPGEHHICCGTCWASGLFVTQPSDAHLSHPQKQCDAIDAAAKLSDAQINSVAPGAPKIFKMISPGEGDEPRGTYYMKTDNDYADTTPGMGLLPLEFSDRWDSGFSQRGACGEQRVDSECVYGNTCNRIFTDYSSEIGCYNWSPENGGHFQDGAGAYTGERCFNDGAPCSHHLIQVRKTPYWPQKLGHFSLF